MKYSFAIIFTVFLISATTTPAYSQSILQKWFPAVFPYEETPDPSKTLIAPFADPVLLEKSKAIPKGVLPENATSLDKAHRSSGQIGEWVLREASGALTFPATDFDAAMNEKKLFFSDEGWAQYNTFLSSVKMPQTIKSGQYRIQSFSNEKPLLLNEGVVNGSYKWLFDVPITVSYLKSNMASYAKSEAVNQHMMLRVQVGRSPEATNSAGVLIDQWSGKVVTKK
jgi:hypothetical protein